MKEAWVVLETATVGHALSSIYQVTRCLSSIHSTQEGAEGKAAEENQKAEAARRADTEGKMETYHYMVHGPWLVHP